MRTSLNEIKLIDGRIFNTNPVDDALLFDAMQLINPELEEQVMWQQKAHGLITRYSRRKLKMEIEAAHRQLFHQPQHSGFRRRILSLFQKK